MNYHLSNINVRHYGKLMFELFDKLKDMPDGPERDELIRITANQMKRDLTNGVMGLWIMKKVASDLLVLQMGRSS